MEDWVHPMVVVACGQVTNARRALQKALDDEGRPFVYADNAPMLRDLEHDVRIEDGQPKRVEGPFRELLTTGGTLLLNLTHEEGAPRFTPQQLESLNTLMEEQIWEGQPIACLDKGERVKIVFLVDENTSLTHIASGALASRVTLRDDFSAHTFPDAPDPEIHPPRSHGTDTTVVDLLDDAASWQRTLFGGPELTDLQSWRHRPGALDGFDFSKRSLVLRNAPRDPRLMDLVLALQARRPDAVHLEDGLPEGEAAERVACKQPATDLSQVLLVRPDTVCTLHAGNFDEVLAGSYGAKHGALARLLSALSQAQAKAVRQLPVILVSEPLTSMMWDRLMQHTARFAVAVAPGVRVDPTYLSRVYQADGEALRPAPALSSLHKSKTWSAPVTFLHSADPTLVDSSLPQNSTRIHLTPSTRSDELLYSLQRTPRHGANVGEQGLPGLQVQTHQLVEDLKAGKTVVLHGLETNPGLARDLAPLLHPPHVLVVNGERFAFKGRLIVVSSDRQLIERHGLTPALSDPAPAGDAWREAVIARIGSALSLRTKQAHALVAPVLEWFDTLQHAGVLPRQQPPVRCATVETLCRTLSKLRTSGWWRSPAKDRLLRSLVKDMLIGDYRRPDVAHDTQYAQLKACLKVLLPNEMSAMPPQSVDLARLKDLLGQVRHPQDMTALAWPFLNAFSPDLIKRVIGAPISAAVRLGAQADIGAKVLDMVCAQARAHGIELPPLVAQLPHKPSPVEVRRSYTRPMPLSRDEKLRGKVKQALAQGIFLKGPPGAGKTHLVETLTRGKPVFWASIADEGTAAFGEQLREWATTRPPGTLVIDEANLARPENLAMLKGVFADRTLHVQGRVHRLDADHRIVFTGNADSLPGRSKQQVAQESFATVQFKSMNTVFLRQAFVEPVLDRALESQPIKGWIASSEASRPLDMRLLVTEIGHQTLEIHERLQKAFPAAGLSPRDLEEFLARSLSQLKPDHSALPSLSHNLPSMLAGMALEVYRASLPDDSLAMVQAWLRHQLQVPATSELPELFDASVIGRALQDQELAPTKSSVALAGAVDSWLRSQAAREPFNPKQTTLGKRALLIEGPASRGKDAVVKAMLQAQGKREGIDFVHLNANPNDLNDLRTAVAKARERGQVVLVSELNLLPSGILEGELNTLLTGQTGQPAAPGFALIATINPGYAGRQTFSQALRNRMHSLKLQDYAPDEILPIARAHASKLASAGPSTSRFASTSTTATPTVPDHKIEDLVQKHVELMDKLLGQSAEFRPGIRQLRDALGLLARQPTMTVEEAFASQYGFYRNIAKRPAVVPPASAKAQELRVANQLSAALGLAYPGMCQPGWRADRTRSVAVPLLYDAKRHELRFHPDGKPEQLTSFMLEQARQGRLFVGRLTDAALKPAQSAPVAFKPSPFHLSGVGTVGRTDHVGRIENHGQDDVNLVTSRMTLSGQPWPWAARHADNTRNPLPEQALRISLRDRPTELVDGERRVYVPVPADRRPNAVRFGNHQPAIVHRDKQGGWYVVAPNATHSVGTVDYSLVEYVDPEDQEDHTRSGLPPNFPDLTRAFNAPLAEKISSLSSRRARLSDIDVARELEAIFKETLEYSHDDAEALELASSMGERCERFLSVGQGVCHEFATSYAAVLMQSFSIKARLCKGHVAHANTGNIDAAGHAWVEVRDAQGRWETMDPTAALAGAQGAGRLLGASSDAQASGEERNQFFLQEAAWANLFNERFEPELLEAISLDALGLTRSEMQRGGARYHPTTGVLELKRAIAGEPDMFRRGALIDATKPRTVVIEDLPPLGSAEAWTRFWALNSRPLAALQRKGVPVLMRDERGALQPAAFVRKIEARSRSNARQTATDLKDGAVVIDEHGNDLIERIASKYYESLLKANGVDSRRLDDVKLCVLHDLRDNVVGRSFSLPIELTLHGERIVIRDSDMDKLLSSARKDIERLVNVYTPTGRFVSLPATGSDAARDIEDTLVRAARVVLLRGMGERPGFSACAHSLHDFLRSFIEWTPSLESGELIRYFSTATWALPDDRHSEKVRHVRLMTDLLSSSKSKSPAVNEKLAQALASALKERLVPVQRQADVLDHLERHTRRMPAEEKALVLSALIFAVAEKRRSSLGPAILARCRALCTTLADSASNFVPLYLQQMGGNMFFAYTAGDDTATKAWAMSMYNKFSKAMQALPMDSSHRTADYLCSALRAGTLTVSEHQRAAAEILERLVDDSHEIDHDTQRMMDEKLRGAISHGTIGSDLIPRFQAIRQRVKQMQVVH